jgi:hypothetical protein
MRYNPNYFLLKDDIAARAGGEAYTTWLKQYRNLLSDLRNPKKGKPLSEAAIRTKEIAWKKKNKQPKKGIAPYNPFTEYRIDKEGTITTHTWTNYTDYLLGDGVGDFKRPNGNHIPLYTNLREHVPAGNPNYERGSQFKNTYLKVNSEKKLTLEELKKDSKNKQEKESKTTPSDNSQEFKDLKEKLEGIKPQYGGQVLTLRNEKGEEVKVKVEFSENLVATVEVVDHYRGEEARVKLEDMWQGDWANFSESDVIDTLKAQKGFSLVLPEVEFESAPTEEKEEKKGRKKRKPRNSNKVTKKCKKKKSNGL